MLTFDHGRRRFTLRAAAVVWHDGRVLLHREERADYWAMPGGRVEWMESAEQALRREMREELDLEARVERLLWVAENFFSDRGRDYHELALYFLASFPPDAFIYQGDGPFPGREQELPLIFRWFPAGRLASEPLYPTFLRTGLRVLPATTQHIVHHDVE